MEVIDQPIKVVHPILRLVHNYTLAVITPTYNPASFIRGHVTVHLHPLAGVSVDVNGVDAAQSLSI